MRFPFLSFFRMVASLRMNCIAQCRSFLLTYFTKVQPVAFASDCIKGGFRCKQRPPPFFSPFCGPPSRVWVGSRMTDDSRYLHPKCPDLRSSKWRVQKIRPSLSSQLFSRMCFEPETHFLIKTTPLDVGNSPNARFTIPLQRPGALFTAP